MSILRLSVLTVITMIAFAGNSLLCRIALSTTDIDPASFTTIRLVSGAITLFFLVWITKGERSIGGNWVSAFFLFAYAAAFSFAYIDLSAATGALLLFGAVQITMIAYGIYSGERLDKYQLFGVLTAIAGLIGLLSPGLSAPPLLAALLMIGAGIAWGLYSLRGRGAGDATIATAGNFIRAVPYGVIVSILWLSNLELDIAGVGWAIASGAVTSGIGYAIWYAILPSLTATTAAIVQLSVPAIAAFGGVIFLAETISLRLLMASLAILGGVAIFILSKGGYFSRKLS